MIEIDRDTFQTRITSLVEHAADKNVILGMLEPKLEKIDADTLSLEVSFPAKDWEHNAAGTVHGGITATMLDTTMGCLAYALTGTLAPTVSLSVNFCRPAPGDGTFRIRCHADMAGSGVLCIRGDVWDTRAPDKVVATAHGVFRNTGKPFPAEYNGIAK